jgi:hypothetical protein
MIQRKERFWKRAGTVTRVMDCWPWLGSKSRQGYGHIKMENKTWKGAHVFAYEEVIGPVPKGLHLHHECRNPSCVNPFHLIPLTHADHFLLHRKPGSNRRLPNESNPKIYCACGCGISFKKFGSYERPRTLIKGHAVKNTHCIRGHSLSGENLYRSPRSTRNMCRACRKIWAQKRIRK